MEEWDLVAKWEDGKMKLLKGEALMVEERVTELIKLA